MHATVAGLKWHASKNPPRRMQREKRGNDRGPIARTSCTASGARVAGGANLGADEPTPSVQYLPPRRPRTNQPVGEDRY